MKTIQDVFVIGGGINGTAIAADAAGRGLSVTLCEKNDLASGTSSASTKLIHGGLRYLEFYEFNLVRKALQEREILMRRAPNIITPLEFVLPHEPHLRPAWMIRMGLFLYDHLSKRNFLDKSKTINFETDIRGVALNSQFKTGFSYYDCFTDDARLVLLNALSAKEHGANILTRTKFISATQENNYWKIQVKNSNEETILYAKILINVAGPWVKETQNNIENNNLDFKIKLDKGSHIVIPKLYAGEFAYFLQHKDNRIIFTIPYLKDFTLIGTTDISYSQNLDKVKIEDEEKIYLCNIINHYFKKNIQLNDIIWSYSGVRCLQDNQNIAPSKTTRDYKIVLQTESSPPLLTVIGGKLTTHRTLAETAVNKLKPFFPKMSSTWTSKKALPGCDFPNSNFEKFCQVFYSHFPWLNQNLAHRYAINYGTRAFDLLKDVKTLSDLGEEFAAGLFQKEVEFLMEHEWAQTCDDILWRRTKLGIFFNDHDKEKLINFLKTIR